MTTELIEAIKKIQELKGLSGQAFSKSLGVDPSTWSKIKSGKAPPGVKFLRAVSRACPELRLAVYKYMNAQEEAVV